jgi:hypothetical protein
MPRRWSALYVLSVLTKTPHWPELQAARRAPSPRRRRASARRKRHAVGIVAVAVSLALSAGGAYALGLFGPTTEAADPPSAVADARTAIAESVALRADLAGELKDARTILKGPDGQAAEQAERRTLDAAISDAERVVTSLGSVETSPSGTVDEANAVLALTGAIHDDVPVVTAALREATATVVASGRQVRLVRAVSELEAARTALQAAVADGEQTYAEAAEVPDRAGLRAELDQAGDLSARADELLEAAAEAQAAAGSHTAASRAGAASPTSAAPRANAVADLLGQAGKLTTAMCEAATRIQTATAAVLARTADDEPGIEADGADPATGDTGADLADDEAAAESADTTSTPAGTCPEPDQVWSAENGHLSSSELAAIPFASSHYVRADVVGGLADLNAAYAAEFGVNLTINSSYRTYAQQEALYDPSSKTAAPPGCSNHGTGLAIDIGGGVQTFGSAQYDWLKANAEAYGWVHPPFAEPSGRNPEPWHWQSVHAPNSY